jgi:hypothetical protein
MFRNGYEMTKPASAEILRLAGANTAWYDGYKYASVALLLLGSTVMLCFPRAESDDTLQ